MSETENETPTTTVRLQIVEVEHGKNVIPTTVPEHEVEVLKVIHGDDKVRVIDPDFDVVEVDANGDAEIARLTNAYRRVNAPDPVRRAFPGGANDLREHGFGRGNTKQVPQSVAVDHGAAEREARKAAAKDRAATKAATKSAK